MDENTLPISDSAPTDFTKGTPAGGWRSIKDFTAEPHFITATDSKNRFYSPFRNLGVSSDFRMRFQDMDKAVKEDRYIPSKHIISSGEASWLPVQIESDVDLGGFTQSIGYDKEKDQYYLSVVDIWDFDPDEYSKKWADQGTPESRRFIKNQAKLMDAAGTGVGIYDRYYIPDDVIEEWRKPEPKRQAKKPAKRRNHGDFTIQ